MYAPAPPASRSNRRGKLIAGLVGIGAVALIAAVFIGVALGQDDDSADADSGIDATETSQPVETADTNDDYVADEPVSEDEAYGDDEYSDDEYSEDEYSEDEAADAYDPALDALSSLEEIAAGDEVNVEEISGLWTVQLSSKTEGTEEAGTVYDYNDILTLHQEFTEMYSTALLVNSSEWSSYQYGGYWVTLLGQTFETSRDALEWCRSNGFDADGIDTDSCAAKRVSRDGDYREDTDVWPPQDD